ncbi:MAG: phosphotyrosine protein phosphatase [Planctomycetes bacterium]|nr:phosphotyrosine protein phosphatase [Planctomycetota bacterium]
MRLLFVCARNRLRSPTAEHIFAAAPGFETDSAAIAPDAENRITPELIAWSDVILVMEPSHKAKLTKSFSKLLCGKRLVCLDIPDEYGFMDPELVPLLWERVPRFVPSLSGAKPE